LIQPITIERTSLLLVSHIFIRTGQITSMDDTTICYEPIGVIRTDYSSGDELPKQAANSEGTARVELRDEYAAGVTDLDGFPTSFSSTISIKPPIRPRC
jgi:hypothetical protein